VNLDGAMINIKKFSVLFLRIGKTENKYEKREIHIKPDFDKVDVVISWLFK